LGKWIRVVEEHEPSFSYSVKLKKGETVNVGEEDDEMPGWFWCTNVNGLGCWVPSIYLERDERKGKLITDYESTELQATKGEEMEFIREAAGWIWCRTDDRRRGWLPRNKVELIKTPT